jgi:hypothetical protein
LGKGGGEIGDRYELPKSTTSITRVFQRTNNIHDLSNISLFFSGK